MSEKVLELPSKPRKAVKKNPWVTTFYGPAKVGKTTILSQLDGCLIIDTEKGADMVDAMVIQPSSLSEFSNYLDAIAERKERYSYIAIDTVSKLVEWIEKAVCKKNGVNVIGDIPYGAGYDAVRTATMTYIHRLKRYTDHLIVCGHRKKTIIGTDKIEVQADNLDLTGKLRNIVMADSDAIGFLYREKDGKLMVTFNSKEDQMDAGSRCNHLKNQTFEFDWSKIFID
jgi:hypothetical protein